MRIFRPGLPRLPPPCFSRIAPAPLSQTCSRDPSPATCPAPPLSFRRPVAYLPQALPVEQTQLPHPSTSSLPQKNWHAFSSLAPCPDSPPERILPCSFLGKVLQRLFDQPRRSRVRIARAVPFHRKIAFITMLFRDPERLRQIDVRDFAFFSDFRFLHVRNAIRVSKHHLDAFVRIIVVVRRHRISKIRHAAQPPPIPFLDRFPDHEPLFPSRTSLLPAHH